MTAQRAVDPSESVTLIGRVLTYKNAYKIRNYSVDTPRYMFCRHRSHLQRVSVCVISC